MSEVTIITKLVTQATAVSLGLFDGVHLGHRAVLHAAAACRREGLLPCAFTFQAATMPQKHGMVLEYLYTEEQKLERMAEIGVAAVYQPDFAALRELDGAAFCKTILQELLHAKRVFCGRDFRFGRKAGWGFDDLTAFGREYGFTVTEIAPVRQRGIVVSSSAIRQALKNGNPEQAALMLGEPYGIAGPVVHGKALGRTISFPTINILLRPGQLVPRYGVYAVMVRLPSGQRYPGVANIGVKPTVTDVPVPAIETHLLNFTGDLYDAVCQVELHHFLRDERKFDTIEALQKAISNDCQAVARCDVQKLDFE